jgi:hypothetical protein
MKSININVIFTYENKDQDGIDLYMSEDEFGYNLRNEVAFIKWVINKSFFRDIEQADDLLKISMCVKPENMSDKEFTKWTGIKEFLARGGKYYFQPDQRDRAENLIIEGTDIASETKPLNQQVN